jgi:hypothetical protein
VVEACEAEIQQRLPERGLRLHVSEDERRAPDAGRALRTAALPRRFGATTEDAANLVAIAADDGAWIDDREISGCSARSRSAVPRATTCAYPPRTW